MKSEEVIQYFSDHCSYFSQIYKKLSKKTRVIYWVVFLSLVTLGIVMVILSWIYNKSVLFPIGLIVLFIIAVIVFLLRSREIKAIELKYCQDHGNPKFDEISYARLKSYLRKNDSLYRYNIEVLKKEIENEIKDLLFDIITFFAIAAVIYGSIFSAFVQQCFIPMDSMQSLIQNLEVLLFLLMLGYFICKTLVPAQQISLMLNKKYTCYAGLKKLSKFLSDILLELKKNK